MHTSSNMFHCGGISAVNGHGVGCMGYATFVVALLLADSILLQTAFAGGLPFNSIPDQDNYTFIFTSATVLPDSQPNLFTGIAAAFHEANAQGGAHPNGGISATTADGRSYFKLFVTNQTGIASLALNTNDNATGKVILDNLVEGRLAAFANFSAYRAANPSNTMNDYLLSIGADPSNASDWKARDAMAGRFMGFVDGSGLASYSTIETCLAHGYSGYNLVTSSFATLNNPIFINLRSSAGIEIPVVINLAFHRVGLQCTSILALTLQLEEANMEQFRTYLGSSGYPYTLLSRPSSDFYSVSQIAGGLVSNPSCIFILDAGAVVSVVVSLLPVLTTHSMTNTTLLVASVSYQPLYDVATYPIYKNLYSSQIVPDPNDSSYDFTTRGKAALTKFINDVPLELFGNASYANCSILNTSVTATLPPAVSASGCMIESVLQARLPDFQMMEGYAMGRLLIEIIRSTPNATMESIRSTIFRQRLFLLDDFDLGPYSNRCSSGGSIPCFCTSGVRTFFSSRVNASTGTSFAIKDRPELGEYDVATTTFPYSSCLDTVPVMRRAFNILIVELDGAALSDSEYAVYLASIELALYSCVKDASFKSVGSFLVTRVTVSGSSVDPTTGEVTFSTADLDSISVLAGRYRPFAILPTFYHATSPALDSIASSVSSAIIDAPFTKLRPTAEAGPGSANALQIDGTLAQYCHSAAYFASRLSSTISSVAIIADDTSNTMNCEKSLNTFGLSPSSKMTTTSTPSFANSVSSALAINAQLTIVVTSDAATLKASLSAIMSTAAVGTNSKIVFVSAESTVFQAANDTLPSSPPPASVMAALYFASFMKAWWFSTSPIGLRSAAYFYQDGVSSNLAAFRSLPAHGRASELAMILLALGTQATSSAREGVLTAPSLLQTAYDAGTIDVGTTSVGAFTNTSCASETERLAGNRLCECRDGISELYVHSLQSLMAGSFGAGENSTVQGSALYVSQYRIVGCSISYQPLPESKSSQEQSTMIAAVAGSVGGLLVLVVVAAAVVFGCFVGKSNKNAPKNDDQPFTMVFTDIQSSTVLWARSPAAMAKAVDLHHELIRSQIEKYGGYEVKTIGDSFMVAFKDPLNALEFSVNVQSALFDSTNWAPEIDNVYKETLSDLLDYYLRSRDLALAGGLLPRSVSAASNGFEAMLSATSLGSMLGKRLYSEGHIDSIAVAHNQEDLEAVELVPFEHRTGGESRENSPRQVEVSGELCHSLKGVDSDNSIQRHHQQPEMYQVNMEERGGSTTPVLPSATPAVPITPLFSVPSSPSQHIHQQEYNTTLIAAALQEERFFESTHRLLMVNPVEYAQLWHGVRVRVGMHTGFGEIKKDAVSGGFDYYGTVVNTAARVEGVGHGGQVLISASSYAEVAPSIQRRKDLVITDLGLQALRGLDTPVGIYQISLTRFAGRCFPPPRLDVENFAADADDDDDDSWMKESSVATETTPDPSISTASPTQVSKLTTSSGNSIDYLDPDNLAECITNGAFIGFGNVRGCGAVIEGPLPTIQLDSDSRSMGVSASNGTNPPTIANNNSSYICPTDAGTFFDYYKFVVMMLSTLPPAKAQAILTDVSRPWRVKLPKEKTILKRAAQKRKKEGKRRKSKKALSVGGWREPH